MEDLSEDEKIAELLPITIQQVFVLAQLGQVEEASKLCATIEPSE